MEETKKVQVMYSEVIKVLGAILKDDGEIVVAAYSGIPKGHTIEASFMKGTLKARIDEIKKQKDNGHHIHHRIHIQGTL